MPVIVVPTRWKRQPTSPQKVDWRHPLADKLTEFGYVLGGIGPYSAVQPTQRANYVYVSGTGTPANTKHGNAITVSGTGNYINFNRNISAPTQVASGWVRTRVNSLSAIGILLSSASASTTNYYGHWVQHNTAGGLVAFYGDGAGTATSNYRRALVDSVVSAGEDASFAFVCRAATDWSLYKNGANLGTPTYSGTATAYATGTGNGTINYRDAVVAYGDQSASTWAYWSRALTDAEMRALEEAPFQILVPDRRRIWVAVGVGGQTLTPSVFTDSDTFHAPTVTPGAVSLSPSLFTDADTFHAATIGLNLTPSLFSDGDTFHAATVSHGLTASLFTDADTFHAPTVSVGAVDLAPSLFEDGDTFHAATVSQEGVQNLSPSLFVDGDTFYSPSVASDQTLTASVFVNANTFHTATVGDGTTTVTTSSGRYFTPQPEKKKKKKAQVQVERTKIEAERFDIEPALLRSLIDEELAINSSLTRLEAEIGARLRFANENELYYEELALLLLAA